MAADQKNSLGEKACMDGFNGLNFHMTLKSLKIIHAWVSTAHFCKRYEN